MSGLLCSGNVRIALLNDDGSNKGYLPLKNTIKLALNPGAVNSQVRVSKMIDSFGQNLDTVNIPGGPTIAISVDDVDADTVGMAFRGDVVDLNLPALTAAASTITVTPGQWYPVAPTGYKIGTLLVKSDDGVDTYVAGTDYKLDADGAMIYIDPAGDIIAGDIGLTVTAPAVTGKRINPGTKAALRIAVSGRMKNLATGKYMVVNVPDASVSPGADVDFLSGDFAVNEMTGPIRTAVGSAPYTVDFLD